MKNKIKIDKLESSITEIFEKYAKVTNEAIEKSAIKIADEAVINLKQLSPKNTGKYAKGWRRKEGKTKNGYTIVIHNIKYQLTHLLEYGHAKRNGGRVEAQPHIKPVEERVVKEFEEELIKEIENE